jgi:KUP system potassium uptake protein
MSSEEAAAQSQSAADAGEYTKPHANNGDHSGGGHGKAGMAALVVGALGIVYGDIGTSPIYAFREAFEGHGLEVTRDGALGAASLAFWALIIVISIKYLLLVMRLDNKGEGGILALGSLLPKVAKGRSTLVFLGLAIFGTALLYGDGMITPAISVLSAVEGIGVATKALDDFIVPISVAILAALFLIQKRGTGGISKVFGPIMVLWFGVLSLLGIVQIAKTPSVLQALNPLWAVRFFSEYHWEAFWALGSIFLVVTGGEALYADMGHFGRRPIAVGWFSVVFASLSLNYMGQAALLVREPESIRAPFFLMAPHWAIWPLAILATAATVIASQALISGAFSLTTQAMRLDYLPRLLVTHTSASHMGQVYVPIVNWILMIASIGLVLGFRTSANLAAAYGLAVTMTMAITTLLFISLSQTRWKWSKAKAWTIGAPLLAIDLAFLIAQLVKIPKGGWFALVIGIVQFTLMATWRRGRTIIAHEIKRGETPVSAFVDSLPKAQWTRVPGIAVYLFKDAGATPPALLVNLKHNRALHERVVLLAIETADLAVVPGNERAEVEKVGPGVWQVKLTFGFTDIQDVPTALNSIHAAGLDFDPAEATYFLGRETVVSTPLKTLPGWQEQLFVMQNRTAASAARFFGLPSNQVFEVGTTIEI